MREKSALGARASVKASSSLPPPPPRILAAPLCAQMDVYHYTLPDGTLLCDFDQPLVRTGKLHRSLPSPALCWLIDETVSNSPIAFVSRRTPATRVPRWACWCAPWWAWAWTHPRPSPLC